MTARLAHVPVPRSGETLSSILLRLARSHVATPHEFCSMLWPGFQFWTRDLDRTATDALLETVSRETGLPRATLELATLRGVVKAMGFPERLHGVQDGILPIGVYHRVRRRFGQQYCSECLAEEPAYLRRLWRFEFLIACPVHGTMLLDACPDCDAPFIPHRFDSMTMRRCHHCGALLTTRRTRSPTLHAAMLQQALLHVLARSLGDVVDVLRHSALAVPNWPVLVGIPDGELFDGIHRLCRVAESACSEIMRCPDGSPRSWPLTRTAERAVVMECVGRWLEGWPDTWFEWANARRLTRYFLEANFGPWPVWTQPLLHRLPYAHGPVDYRRSRPLGFRVLRRQCASVALWREARAHLLLRRASQTGSSPK